MSGEIKKKKTHRKQEQYKVKYLINLQSTQNVGEIQDKYRMVSYSFLFRFNSSPGNMTHSQSYSFDHFHLNLINRNILDF